MSLPTLSQLDAVKCFQIFKARLEIPEADFTELSASAPLPEPFEYAQMPKLIDAFLELHIEHRDCRNYLIDYFGADRVKIKRDSLAPLLTTTP